ncbi:hypothetical protein QBC40DRAFT_284532 [Triangularia verruculosa]|uniref:NADH-cytochrome b5 reductase n=1 Tax=Triangularia verruculosa TaxID=2587418 RepID=A0AAN6XCH2_9PEZI|nr:hypothetical protein QBC40DRAFT_284532 [Triangularia verruculosa]
MPPTTSSFRPFFTQNSRLLRQPFGAAPRRAEVMTTQVAFAAAAVGIGAYVYMRTGAAAAPGTSATGTGSDSKPYFSGFGLRTLKLHSSELVNHNTKKLRFELPDPSQPSGLSLSSALLTISFPPTNGRWTPVVRPYTPTNPLEEPGFVELMVKLYPNGKQSGYLHSLKPGDTITCLRIPEYVWQPNKHDHVALIAGGAGITPMYQLIQGILGNPEDKTRVTLVWGVNGDQDIFLKQELAELQSKYPGRFRAEYVVSQPEAGSTYRKGYVNGKALEELGLGANDEKNKNVKVMVCGPPAMEKALKGGKGPFANKTGVLHELGYKPDQIYSF